VSASTESVVSPFGKGMPPVIATVSIEVRTCSSACSVRVECRRAALA
jgi:hypothetical protein